jgi:hypothetical protein
LQKLIELAEVGHLTQLKKHLEALEQQGQISPALGDQFRLWLQEVRFDKILDVLRNSADG